MLKNFNKQDIVFLPKDRKIDLEELEIDYYISIIYYNTYINRYNKNSIYPQIRSDNKIQLRVYINSYSKLYKYNDNLKLITITWKDLSYMLGFYLNKNNELTELKEIKQIMIFK